MSKRSWFKSLLLPILSILIITVFMIVTAPNGGFGVGEKLYLCMFMLIFGYILCGIVPLVIIIKDKIDISGYFAGKIIMLAASIVGVVCSLTVAFDWTSEGYNPLVIPILIAVAEGVFAAVKKTNLKTKLCLFLSSPSFIYIGLMIDVIRSANSY